MYYRIHGGCPIPAARNEFQQTLGKKRLIFRCLKSLSYFRQLWLSSAPMHNLSDKPEISKRFRSFLPVVVDVETGGFNPTTDALLEIAAVTIIMDESGILRPDQTYVTHVIPFAGANIEAKALEFNGIRPDSPLRAARSEREALDYIFSPIRKALKAHACTRAILVGHNAFFDLQFLNAAIERTNAKHNPFHAFSSFDTVTLGGMAYGQTVLARAAQAAGLNWDTREAHSAAYDARQTAELFCRIINNWDAQNSHIQSVLYEE